VEKWGTEGPTKGNVSGGDFKLEDVAYVVGSKWKQRFLVKDPATGGHQFLNKQYNSGSGNWENYGNKNTWGTMCATCHATGYRVTSYDPANPKAQTVTWSEMNIGCETCHGPGARHAESSDKRDIYSFKGKPKAEQSRVCGYCHIRIDNEQFKSAQGNTREDLPAPKVGDTWRPGDDWTQWYPEHVVMPGIQPEDKVDADYTGDLKGLFIKDDAAKAMGAHDSAKHHQQYQEYLQSSHHRKDVTSCVDCHGGLHAGEGIALRKPAKTCAVCHDDSVTVEKFMPATGRTAENLFVRTHTFNKNQSRLGGPTATKDPELEKK
jgi:hypothetical protein